MKRIKGTVVAARPVLRSERLRVVAQIRTEAGELLEAGMPDREVSAIVPRSILLGAGTKAPLALLDTIAPILARMSEGRAVRIWEYKEQKFFSFQPWRGVRFLPDGEI